MTRAHEVLPASRDEATGQLYVPPRRWAADGSLRECAPTEVAAAGVLRGWTTYQDVRYGLIALDAGPRVQVRLDDDDPVFDGRYVGVADDDSVRFIRA